MTVERNTQQGNGQDEGDRHTESALFGVAFVHTPDKDCGKQNDIYHYA